VLDAVKRRFPDADIYLVGPRKNWELFEADARIDLHEFAYQRAGSMAERLSSWPVFSAEDSIVVDPDSRLSQLGLLPVCPETGITSSRAGPTRHWKRLPSEADKALGGTYVRCGQCARVHCARKRGRRLPTSW
jgi:hypothetical protein